MPAVLGSAEAALRSTDETATVEDVLLEMEQRCRAEKLRLIEVELRRQLDDLEQKHQARLRLLESTTFNIEQEKRDARHSLEEVHSLAKISVEAHARKRRARVAEELQSFMQQTVLLALPAEIKSMPWRQAGPYLSGAPQWPDRHASGAGGAVLASGGGVRGGFSGRPLAVSQKENRSPVGEREYGQKKSPLPAGREDTKDSLFGSTMGEDSTQLFSQYMQRSSPMEKYPPKDLQAQKKENEATKQAIKSTTEEMGKLPKDARRSKVDELLRQKEELLRRSDARSGGRHGPMNIEI